MSDYAPASQSLAMPPEAMPEPVEAPQEAPVTTLDRDAMLGELLVWSKGFINRSAEWRRSSFEDQWRRWQRDADSTYDHEQAKRKESWQSKAVWPLTASHRENAQAQLFKTEVGASPAIEVKARDGVVPQNVPGADQSDNIRDLVLRERERAEYEINRNDVLEDKTTFGSGFAQVFFETVIEDRVLQEPIQEDIQAPWNDGGASIQRALAGQRQIVGYKPVVQPQVIFRGMRFRYISIWDVFPDPQALKISKAHPIGIRYSLTYGDIVEGAKPTPDRKPGYVLPEAVEKLKNSPTTETFPADKQPVMADRGITEAKVERTPHGQILRCYEIQAMLPKKWVLIDGQDIDNPDALMPAKVRFHDLCVISVFPNESYDGEPDLYKDDYMPRASSFYGVGVPEMGKDCQAVATEQVNMRLDVGKVSLLNVYAVIEKAVLDPKDFTLGPGSVLRFKASDGITNVDQLFRKVDMGTIDRAAFMEPQEWERAMQERTSITQTTLGTQDNADMTLGAQKIQQGVTGLKIAYLGMLSEFGFQRQVFKAFWKNIYLNYQPEDYALALGPERAATIIPTTPEQVENNYQYYPLGVFEQENKAQRQAQIAGWVQQFGVYPWANILEAAKEELRSMDIESEKLIVPEAEAIQIVQKAQQMAQGMAQQMVSAQAGPGGPGKGPGVPPGPVVAM